MSSDELGRRRPEGVARQCGSGPATRWFAPVPPPHLGFYAYGYLPHYDAGEVCQVITYRLWDALPAAALAGMAEELGEEREQTGTGVLPLQEARRRQRVERLLDAGHGCCWLRYAAAAELIVANWQQFAGERYRLIAWVVMPNHVHVLVRVVAGHPLGRIILSWKNYTARRLNDLARAGALGEGDGTGRLSRIDLRPPQAVTGAARKCSTPRRAARAPVWQRGYWDRFIRDEEHFHNAVKYIHENPVRAGLVATAGAWAWSSGGSAAKG